MDALRRICQAEPLLHEVTREITVPAPDGARTLTEVVRALDAASITPDDIGLHKPSLDDVFLSLTGRPAEADAGDEAAANGSNQRRRRRRP